MKVKLYCHVWALACFGLLPTDTIPPTTQHVDTLREVEVRADSILPVTKAIKKSISAAPQPIKVPSLADLLEKVSPGINDKITHPFAIKERRLERKHKRDQKILRDFDRVRTFQDLLDEAVTRQQLEDEKNKKQPETTK